MSFSSELPREPTLSRAVIYSVLRFSWLDEFKIKSYLFNSEVGKFLYYRGGKLKKIV